MKNYQEIETYLWNVNVDDLKRYCTLIHANKKGNKQAIIDSIMSTYQEGFPKQNYQQLNPYEKAMVDNYVQQKKNPLKKTITKIEQEYPEYKLGETYYHFFIPANSDGIFMPDCLYKEIVDLVPKRKIEFIEEKPGALESFYATYLNSQNCTNNFDCFIKYINSNKVKPTAKNRHLSKKDIIKIQQEANYPEIMRSELITIENGRNLEDTTISYGIFKLLIASHVIEDRHEYFRLGPSKEEYAQKNRVEKIRFLLEEYLNCSSVYINEIERNQAATIKTEVNPELQPVRKYLIEFLKKVPINKWIRGSAFKEQIRMNNCFFLRQHLNTFLMKDEYYNSYYEEPGFSYLEEPFIDVFLMEYLAPLGIIDIAVDNAEVGYWDVKIANRVDYLKLTEFGAIVLNLKEMKSIKEEDNGFTIDENLILKIYPGSNQMKYELYFERFLTKIAENTYQFDFQGLARALDLNIEAASILDYIMKYGKNIHKEALHSLKKWRQNADKIRIRTVDIIEFPPELTKLFTEKEIRENLEKTTNKYLIVKKKKSASLKQAIQKEKFYCQMDSQEKG